MSLLCDFIGHKFQLSKDSKFRRCLRCGHTEEQMHPGDYGWFAILPEINKEYPAQSDFISKGQEEKQP